MSMAKCIQCGGPLPEDALIVKAADMPLYKINVKRRNVTVVAFNADDFALPTKVCNGVCGYWCALGIFGEGLDALLSLYDPEPADSGKEA